MKKLVIALLFAVLPAIYWAQENGFRRLLIQHEFGLNLLQVPHVDGDDTRLLAGVFYRLALQKMHFRLSGTYNTSDYAYGEVEPNVQQSGIPLTDYRYGWFRLYESRCGAGWSFVSRAVLDVYIFTELGFRYRTHTGKYGYNGYEHADNFKTTGAGICFGPGVKYNVWKGLVLTFEANWGYWTSKTRFTSRGSISRNDGSTEFFPVNTLGISWRF